MTCESKQKSVFGSGKVMCRLLIALCLIFSILPVWAQQSPLSIEQAVQQALEKYPAVHASLEQVAAAAAGINLARSAYLPRADFLGQVNRATRNNVFGLLLPQSVIPSISGPVLGTNDLTNVWGSAVGVLVSWEPFDFGLRKANVELAADARTRRESELSVTRLQVSTAAADGFLTLLAAQQTVASAKAAVERGRLVDQVISARAQSGLRPGADAARAHAELALADTQLARAEQAAEVAQVALANFLGMPAGQLMIQPGPLLGPPPATQPPPNMLSAHPAAQQQQTSIEEVKDQERVLDRSYYPRFYLQGSSYARGTGARTDGATGGGFSGLGPNIQNWALGITVTFPAFDFFSIRARKEVQLHRERSETAQYERLLQDLQGQLEQAQAQYQGAVRVARNTPVQLEAARTAEQQATARYNSGLGNIIEVAEGQRLLTQAEIDDSLARLGVWRALLGIAAAQGSLQPFLQSAAK
jgi:outer membrane protein